MSRTLSARHRVGACGGVVVLAGLLVLGGCGTAPGSVWRDTAGMGGTPSATILVPGTVSATGTVVRAADPPPTAPPDERQAGGAPPPGIAAIPPSKQGTGPDDPAFTEQDARDFVARHGAGGFRLVATGPVAVTRVVFARGPDIGWPDYPLLCLVTVHGDYRLNGGPAPQPGAPPRSPIVYDGATLIFDAHTGNALGVSAPAWATPTS